MRNISKVGSESITLHKHHDHCSTPATANTSIGLRLQSQESRAIQQQRDWPIIDQRHVHMLLKTASFNMQSVPTQLSNNALIKLFSLVWASGHYKAWSPPFSAIAVKRELANHQQLPVNILQSEIHLAFGILKDSQANQFASDVLDIVLSVGVTNTEQH